MQEWQSEWDAFNQQATEPARQADVERTRIQHLEQRLAQLQQRGEKLQLELTEQSVSAVERDIAELQRKLTETETEVQQNQQALEQHQQRISELRDVTHQRGEQLDETPASIAGPARTVCLPGSTPTGCVG